jgi:hypothetical protein
MVSIWVPRTTRAENRATVRRLRFRLPVTRPALLVRMATVHVDRARWPRRRTVWQVTRAGSDTLAGVPIGLAEIGLSMGAPADIAVVAPPAAVAAGGGA